MARAGEWIVETHSLIIRSPASIAGTEDAAIGDVSTWRFLLASPALSPCQAVACHRFLADLRYGDIAVWSSTLRGFNAE